MAVISIPNTATEQPQQNQTLSNDGSRSFQRSFKDTYANLKTWLDSFSTGDTIDGDAITGSSLTRSPGNMGVLTISLSPFSESTTEGVTTQVALDETWTLKSVRNDKSILAYCGGPSEGNDAHREDVEAWMKEPDGTLAKEYKYKKSDETVYTIASTGTKAVIDKLKAGHDSVMRFYPMLTKKRTYAQPPPSIYENLARIDTPTIGTSATSAKIKQPGNLSSIISDHQWLKCQDDCEQTADGKFVRIESWMGAKNDEEEWDKNFYGSSSRWAMPNTTW